MASQVLEDESSYLAVILDCNPLYWAQHEKKAKQGKKKPKTDFSKVVNTFLVYFNAFLTLHRGNKIAVFGITPKHSKLLFCSKIGNPTDEDENTDMNINNNSNDNFDDMNNNHTEAPQDSEFSFAGMNEQIKNGIDELLKQSQLLETQFEFEQMSISKPNGNNDNDKNGNNNDNDDSKESRQENFGNGSLLAGALSHALCLLNRILLKDLPNIEARILVAYSSSDVSNQYIPIMNCIFSATKRKVTIDAVMLHSDESRFLQQCCDKTNGIYSRPHLMEGLLQHLLMTHLSPQCVRKHLSKPLQKAVDFRVSCFCHQNTIDIGYVCPICLSIFCTQNPMCRTCGSRFSRKKLL